MSVSSQILSSQSISKKIPRKKPKKTTTEIELVEQIVPDSAQRMSINMNETLKRKVDAFKVPKLPGHLSSSSSSSSSSPSSSDSESHAKKSKKKKQYDNKPIEVDLSRIPGNANRNDAPPFDDRDAFTASSNLIFFTVPTSKGRIGHFRKYWFKENRPQVSYYGGDIGKDQVPGLIDWLRRTYDNWDK